MRVYLADGLDRQLEEAARAFLQRETELDPDSAVLTIPQMMRRRFRDFAVSRVDMVRYIIPRLEEGADQLFFKRVAVRHPPSL